MTEDIDALTVIATSFMRVSDHYDQNPGDPSAQDDLAFWMGNLMDSLAELDRRHGEGSGDKMYREVCRVIDRTQQRFTGSMSLQEMDSR